MKRASLIALVCAVVLTLSDAGHAITYFEKDVKCPICGTVNTFMEYGSWGSYVYQWPSKFQLVFWPKTDGTSLYSCKKCRYTAFMWDFEKLPPEKKEEIQRALSSISLSGEHKKYTDIPMSDRMMVAEKVYAVLGQDPESWAEFHRVWGYHLHREKGRDAAVPARTKSLEILRTLLDDPANAGSRKELLIASAAMKHFLLDDKAAMLDLAEAGKLKFSSSKLKEEQVAGYNQYLDQLIAEYVAAIQAGKVPDDVPAGEKNRDGSEQE